MTEDEFVAAVTGGQSVAPLYFGFTADSNRRLHDLLDDAEAPASLGVDDLVRWQGQGAVVLDARSPEEFASGHVRGSVNVGIDGRFAEYAGDVVRPGQPIVLVVDEARSTEARVRLARIGFDGVVGAVVDVERLLAEHPDLAEPARRLGAPEVSTWLAGEPGLQVVDVRNPGETADGTVPGAALVPLARLLERHGELDPAAPTVVYCAGGYRSSIGASLLRSLGFEHVADLQGGFDAWAAAGLPVTVPADRG